MIRRPPISTRTDTRVPYTTLFRSDAVVSSRVPVGIMTPVAIRTGGVSWREVIGAEREQAWQRMLAVWPNFAVYEKRAERTIPVFRSEEHTSELQSLMRISYAVFCLKKKHTTSIKDKHRHECT